MRIDSESLRALERPKKANVRIDRAPSIGEVKTMVIAAQSKQLSVFIHLLATTGLRLSEALRLRVENFDFNAEPPILKIISAKTNLPREVPLTAELVSKLKEIMPGEGRIFSYNRRSAYNSIKYLLSRLSLISTPKGKRGWFYEAWTSDTFSKHQVHYTEAPHITSQDLEGMRASMNPLEWEQEMEMRFLDELNAVFPYELILQCVEDYETGIRKTENHVYLGIDFGRYRDSTVITALEKSDEKLRVILIHEFQKTDFNTQIEFILRLADLLGPVSIAIDKTGMGIPIYDLLSKRLPQLEGITFTSSIKEAMIHTLVNLFSNKKITIPADATQLINQLRQFQRIGEKYSAPEDKHDDYVMSLALACYTAIKKTPHQTKIHTGFWKNTL
ncbi:MAG: tyrosine-type recombinase/integrase [Nitrososphaerota archaeon]